MRTLFICCLLTGYGGLTHAHSPGESGAGREATAQRKDHGSEEEEEEEEQHEGRYFHMALGLGYSWIVAGGTLNPLPGLERVDDPTHQTPTLNLAFDWGAGIIDNLALHLGIYFEKMLTRSPSPEIAFTLLGLGGGASYYFDRIDLYLTTQLRYVGMLLFFPSIVCERYFSDKYEWYGGPGLSFTVGKEWFGNNARGIGLGLQGNFAHLRGDDVNFNYFSLMIVGTVTRF